MHPDVTIPALMQRLKRNLKAFRELGWRQSGLYGLYQLGKRVGFYHLYPRPPAYRGGGMAVLSSQLGPDPGRYAALLGDYAPDLQAEARRILQRRITIFGSLETGLDFRHTSTLQHWTDYDTQRFADQDIKLVWEPARFGWAATLARAFRLNPDPAYRDFFHREVEAFSTSNPAYHGPHWVNGQEVALRLIHIAFAHMAIGWEAPGLYHCLAVHAHRLPGSLIYARAQGNNHLLSEAAALLTAGLLLQGHPKAARWFAQGWGWLNRGLKDQIDPQGAYTQHSANYHRLMLQLALWGGIVAQEADLIYPPATRRRLAAATAWLLALCDPETGRLPNLGPNDGAFILPLSQSPFADFRPVLQAAARSYLGEPAFPPGPWDEAAAWLATPGSAGEASPEPGPLVLEHPALPARAYLRAAQLRGRPGHADQLHLDLWWGGRNIALDPGSFHYNAPPPWENALRSAFHHNTLTVDGHDQMSPAGRFLYLDRAQARVLEKSGRLCAEHDGYRRLGLTHRRTLEATADGWRVADDLIATGAASPRQFELRLHWLLPDHPWTLSSDGLELQAPSGRIELHFRLEPTNVFEISLVRAGDYLSGGGPPALTQGWFSPTYAVKTPALSLIFETRSAVPARITTDWRLIP